MSSWKVREANVNVQQDERFRFISGPFKGRPLNVAGVAYKIVMFEGKEIAQFRDGSRAEFYVRQGPVEEWKPYTCPECRAKGISWYGACPHRPPICGAPVDPGNCEFTCTRDVDHAGEHSWEVGEEIAAGLCELGQTGAMPVVIENRPPICAVHHDQMVLHVYDRPGSPPSNGWVCHRCIGERAEALMGDFGMDKPPICQTPYVCEECRKLNRNWYDNCPHAPKNPGLVAVEPENMTIEDVAIRHPKKNLAAFRTSIGLRPKSSMDPVYAYCENGTQMYTASRAEVGTGLREYLWLFEHLRSMGRGRLAAAVEAWEMYHL